MASHQYYSKVMPKEVALLKKQQYSTICILVIWPVLLRCIISSVWDKDYVEPEPSANLSFAIYVSLALTWVCLMTLFQAQSGSRQNSVFCSSKLSSPRFDYLSSRNFSQLLKATCTFSLHCCLHLQFSNGAGSYTYFKSLWFLPLPHLFCLQSEKVLY